MFGADAVDDVFDWVPTLVQLKKEKFAIPTSDAAYEGYMQKIVEYGVPGRIVLPSVITVDGRPVSWSVDLCLEKCLYLYVSSYDPAFAKLSTGNLHIEAIMRWAIEQNYELVDFLWGDQKYKLDWTDGEAEKLHSIKRNSRHPPQRSASPCRDRIEFTQKVATPFECRNRGARMKGRTAVLGFSVTISSFLVTRLTNLLITIMLARALGTEELGLVAFAFLVVEILDALRDFGLRDTLIYDRSADPVLRMTAFVAIIGIGVLQALALVALAPFAPALVGDSEITAVLVWLALVFPINAVSSIQLAVLQRDFLFGRVAGAEILGAVAKTGLSIALIVAGFGIWSIVAGTIAGAALRSSALWIASEWRPVGVRPTWAKLRELIRYGRHVVAANVMDIVQGRMDQMVIVSVLGSPALGIYYIAARIPEIAIHGIGGVITTVVFPALSNLSQDEERRQVAYRLSVMATMTIIAPISLGMASTAELLVPVLFGDKWGDAVPVFVLLALAGLPVALGWSTGDFLKAAGRPQFLWMFMVAETLFTLPLVLIAANSSLGLVGVAAAMLVGEVFAVALRLIVLHRVAGIAPGVTLAASARALICALAMAVCVIAWVQTNPLSMAPAWLLTTGIAIGCVTYVALLALIDGKNARFWITTILKERT